MTIECGGDGTWLVDNFKIANTIYCEASCGVGVVCPSPEPCLATSTSKTIFERTNIGQIGVP